MTGIINFFTYKQADTIDAFLCDFIYIGLDTVILVAVIFFKGAELIIRQFLTHDFKPKHTVFAFPVWVLVVIYCYLRLLEAMDFLCFVL